MKIALISIVYENFILLQNVRKRDLALAVSGTNVPPVEEKNAVFVILVRNSLVLRRIFSIL